MKTTTRAAIRSAAAFSSFEENDGMSFNFLNELVESDIHNRAWFMAKEAQRWIELESSSVGGDYDSMCLDWLTMSKDNMPKGKDDDYRPIARPAAREALNLGICPEIVKVFFSEVQVTFNDMTVASILSHYINN